MLKVIVACDFLMFLNTIQHEYVVVASQLVTASGLRSGWNSKALLEETLMYMLFPRREGS